VHGARAAARRKLLACDVSEDYTAVAALLAEGGRRGSDRSSARARVTRCARCRNARDFGFIDADKSNYRTYYEEILRRLRPGGLIAIDNVLWSGQVLRETDQTDDTRAIRAINDHVAADRRVQSVMIGVSDGITLARKLG
jgi:caffeoyl-CoA O-methyltransferase